MSEYTFKLPDIGEGIAEAEIAEWKVKVGDTVVEDQPLCDMLTEKAAVEIPSPVNGTVIELKGEAGDLMAVGAALLVIAVDGEGQKAELAPVEVPAAAVAKDKSAEESPPAAAQAPAIAPAPVATKPSSALSKPSRTPQGIPQGGAKAVARAPGERPLASPAVRQRAREMGVELMYVHGSGPAGRIMHEDLDNFAARGNATPGVARQLRTGVEEIKVIGLRRKIAEAMQRSKQRIPHFSYVEEVDVTELEALRQHLNANRQEGQAKLSVLPFLMLALVKAVPDFSQVNAQFDDEAGILHRYDALHIGIAAQTPNGLVVPVVHHAETLDVWGCAAQLQRLAQAAREGSATREELSGSTITISSLGPMGGIASTPVINAPEVAIVGVNKMLLRPMYKDGMLVPRMMMNLSSSFDHRIVDGWDAAAFIQRIKGLLEHPASLFI